MSLGQERRYNFNKCCVGATKVVVLFSIAIYILYHSDVVTMTMSFIGLVDGLVGCTILGWRICSFHTGTGHLDGFYGGPYILTKSLHVT